MRLHWSRRLALGTAALLVASLAADAALLATGHAEQVTWFSTVPGWWALLGLVGMAVVYFVPWLLGHHLLERPEDYYDRHDELHRQHDAEGGWHA
ncbi:MAG: hypothetical protein FJ318_06960 [SAR202 cluster bacterium]|nr:hypothetical protein [SAR202 cluster bacterium]